MRKLQRQLQEAMSNSTSIYRSRKEINMRKETRKLLNCPWFKQMRGGNKIKEVKEGKIRKTSKRCEGNLENLEIERGGLEMGDMKNKDKVKEIEGVHTNVSPAPQADLSSDANKPYLPNSSLNFLLAANTFSFSFTNLIPSSI